MYKFVINLKRRTDRLISFKNRCPYDIGAQTKTNFFGKLLTDKPCSDKVNIIYGFDAKYPAEETPEEQFLLKNVYTNLKYPGDAGCCISHIRIYKMIVENNYPGAIVFEDDAHFSTEFDKKLKRIIKEAPKDYHIIYIGGRFTQDYKMKRESIIPASDHIVQHNINNWYNHDHDRTTHGYIISNRGAKLLLDNFNSGNITSRDAVDFWIMNSFINKQIKIYSAFPLLCWSPMNGDSDIR